MAAYWIAHVNIHDLKQYQYYRGLVPEALAPFGAKFLACGGDAIHLEGERYQQHIIIEFADLATAKACYASAAYQRALAERQHCATVMIDIVDGMASSG